ncbi:universal stress protein [Amphritea opalescens]|uniref:Universal stress protein n=1 Tax=Amphritea opalescens TaxID=2490544 RepID=A0A430KN96_9GAMM|nr:universal stress protein [Amphritea opalescens]RTE64833.1 universal stress protein [Amphritea opalescens]
MIQDIKTILYASDLGENSIEAFYIALNEASKHNAQLVFLHVVEPANAATKTFVEGYLSSPGLSEMRSEGIEKIKALMKNRIETFCQDELAGASLQYQPLTRLEEGPIAETIINIAKELDADLIVMGTRTRTHSLLGRFFLGSAAQAVLQLADRPVLAVPIK